MRPIFSSISLSLFLLHLLLFHQNASPTTATAVDLIDETCKNCAEKSPLLSYDFCMTSLQAVPESYTTNVQGLGIISLELALTNATDTVSSIKKLMKNEEAFDQYAMICLEDCLDLYSDAIPVLGSSIEAFRSNDYVAANIWVSAAMEAARTCEGGFEEKEGEVSPLTKENFDLFQLCDIALVVTHLVSLGSRLFPFMAE